MDLNENKGNNSLQNEQPSQQVPSTSTASPSTLVLLVLGVIGEVFAVYTITSEKSQFFGYSYKPPLTSHEVFMIFIAIVSALFLLIGLVKLSQKKR